MTDKARGVIDPGATSVVIPGVPAGATLTVTAYAEDVYGQVSDPTSDTIDTTAEQVALTDPVSGVPILTTNTSPGSGSVGAHQFLSSEWKRALRNGDIHDSPPFPLLPINNTDNVLPGWVVDDTSSGTIEGFYVADPTTGSGGRLDIIENGAPTGAWSIYQDIGIRSTSTRNNALALITSAAGSATAGNALALDVYEYDSTGSLLDHPISNTHTFVSGDPTLDIQLVAVEGCDAATSFVRVVAGTGDLQAGLTISIYEMQLVEGPPIAVFPDIITPNNPPATIRYSDGHLFINANSVEPTTLAPNNLILPTDTAPSQVVEGAIVFDSDDDVITVGNGALSRKTYGYEGATTPSAVGTASNGSGHEMARVNHVHATGAGTPTTAAYGDAAATGTGPAAAMTDHRHGMPSAPVIPSFAAPAVVLGTAAAAGAASTVIRSDSTIVAFDATAPTTSAVGDAAATGSQAVASRRDHVHGRESFGSTAAAVGTSAGGAATTPSRSDHVHATGAGTPATVGTANATGSGPAAAMTDHVHAHEAAHVAHDTLWAAVGDLPVGTGNDTASILAVSIPAANVRNVLGTDNGDTTPAWKTALDSTTPPGINIDTGNVAGTSLVFSHRDHTHQVVTSSTAPEAVGTSGNAGTTGTGISRRDHVHAHETAHIAHDTLWDSTGDLAVGTGADTAAKLAVSIPAANVRNVLGTDNGDTTPAWKTALDSTNPAALGAAAPGTSLVFAHRDHVHPTTGLSLNTHGIADHDDVTRNQFLPAHVAKLDSGTAANLASSPDLLPVVALADAATQGCSWVWMVPTDWASGSLSFQTAWVPGSTDASSHAVRWSLTVKLLTNALLVTTGGTTVNQTGTSAARTANTEVFTDATIDSTVTPASAGQLLLVGIRRIGADGADSYVGTVNLMGLRMSYTAAQ